jgi:hypothetical protein
MTSTTKSYEITKIKQLIDLNGDSVNFDINFRVYTRDKRPFEMTIVDQATLDNNTSIEYQKVVDGDINGQIIEDKNVYKNYFIILKAEQPCVCFVEIDKKELPVNTNVNTNLNNNMNTNLNNNMNTNIKTPMIPKQPIKVKKSFPWLSLFTVIALAGLSYYLYKYFTKSNNVDELNNQGFSGGNLIVPQPQPVFSPIASPIQTPRFARSSSPEQNNIIDRLRNLSMK